MVYIAVAEKYVLQLENGINRRLGSTVVQLLNGINGSFATAKWPACTADAEQYSTVLLLPVGIYRRC